MTPKQRFLHALNLETPDRLPVTTHHVMPYFLETIMGGISVCEFFDRFRLDPVEWVFSVKPDTAAGACFDPNHEDVDELDQRRLWSEDWRIETEELPDEDYESVRYRFITPMKTLSMILKRGAHTAWVTERLIKEKTDIDLIAKYAPVPLCDVDDVNRRADNLGESGILRGSIPGFDVYGQPGCWQDAAVLIGIERLIIETFDDPPWVHAFLDILRQRKAASIRSMEGARFDLIEHGGGDASSTVISPDIFNRFVAPYDAALIETAHAAGQRVVYHTCGGMMPLLEAIADMHPDAMETFTPPGMGGDVVLSEAKSRIGHRVCMIGGFDQYHYFTGCEPEETRKAVRCCFEEAGEGGGYILAPSDHFFEAEPGLIDAYSDEARACVYG